MSVFFQKTFFLRAVGFALLWAVLSGGAADSWIIGGPIALCATWASIHLRLPYGRPIDALRFFGVFLKLSLLGSVDVARRAFTPGIALNPDIIEFDLYLPDEGARGFFTASIGLLPGTLGANLVGSRVSIHVLDVQSGVEGDLRLLEKRIGALFGCGLSEEPLS